MILDAIGLRHITQWVVNPHAPLHVIVRDISLRCERGRWYALHGVSGSGKSTILHLLAGFISPCEGEVLYNDRPLPGYAADELRVIRYSGVGVVFQESWLINEFSVLENVQLKGHIANIDPVASQEMALELLRALGLEGYENRLPATLSGGEQHRVAIARGLMGHPQFLLIDEPTAHLDTQNKKNMMKVLHTLHDRYGLGMLIATHDPEVAYDADEVWELRDGTLVCVST